LGSFKPNHLVVAAAGNRQRRSVGAFSVSSLVGPNTSIPQAQRRPLVSSPTLMVRDDDVLSAAPADESVTAAGATAARWRRNAEAYAAADVSASWVAHFPFPDFAPAPGSGAGRSGPTHTEATPGSSGPQPAFAAADAVSLLELRALRSLFGRGHAAGIPDLGAARSTLLPHVDLRWLFAQAGASAAHSALRDAPPAAGASSLGGFGARAKGTHGRKNLANLPQHIAIASVNWTRVPLSSAVTLIDSPRSAVALMRGRHDLARVAALVAAAHSVPGRATLPPEASDRVSGNAAHRRLALARREQLSAQAQATAVLHQLAHDYERLCAATSEASIHSSLAADAASASPPPAPPGGRLRPQSRALDRSADCGVRKTALDADIDAARRAALAATVARTADAERRRAAALEASQQRERERDAERAEARRDQTRRAVLVDILAREHAAVRCFSTPGARASSEAPRGRPGAVASAATRIDASSNSDARR
jgi:hypothetical protein